MVKGAVCKTVIRGFESLRRLQKEHKMAKKEIEIKPACIDASDANLDDGLYCKLCGMAWWNCLCCHEDD